MDPFIIGLLGVILLLALLVFGTHVGIALSIAGFIGVAFLSGFEQSIFMTASAIYHKISIPALITLPLFILMGFLASGGGISKNLYDSLNLWLGKFRGGLGISTVMACAAFGTVCGSSIVTTAVFAKISAPEMRKHGYSKELAYAICAAAGSIGMLIPPSILAIVYGMLSGVSIGKVLMAGVAPGILWGIAFSVAIIITGKIKPSSIKYVPMGKVTWYQRFASLKLWWPIFIVSFVTFGGIYGGVFTPSEGAAVAAFVLFAIYIALILKRKSLKGSQKFDELHSMMKDTATTSGMIFLIMGASTVFSNFLVLTGVTTKISTLIQGWELSPSVLVIFISFIYLVLGCFLEGISMLCITIPVFNPIINAAGVDPIWYATIVITSVEIGLITPPVGLNLYAANGVAEADVRLEDIISGIVPFFIAELICLIILFSFPPISTFLPSFIG